MAETTHNVGIRYSGDAQGLVDAAKKGAQAQTELAAAFDKGKEAQKQNSAEAEAFVRKLKEQADTLKMTSLQTEAYRAAKLQLSDAQKQVVANSIAEIKVHQDSERALASLKTTLTAATVAVTAWATAKAMAIKGAIDEADQLNKLSQSLGISSEALSVYRYQAQLADVANEEFATGMKLLAKNVAEAQAGVGDGGRIFSVLGSQIEVAAKHGASLEQLLPLIAERFSQFADGPNKTALALALFGRAGERLIPFLNQGREGLSALREEAERFGVVIGTQTAKRAEEFNDNLRRIQVQLTSFKYAISSDALPWLVKMTDQMVEGTRIAGGFGNALRLFGLGMAPGEASEQIKAQQGRLADLTWQRDQARARGDVAGAGLFQRDIEDTQKKIEFAKYLQRQAALERASGMGDTTDQNDRRLASLRAGLPQAPSIPGADSGSGELRAPRESWQDKLDAEARKAGNERGVALMKEAEEAWKAQAKAQLDAAAAASKWISEQQKATQEILDANAKMREHNEEIGLTAEQLGALRIKRAEETVAILKREEALTSTVLAGDVELKQIQARIAAAEQFLELTREGETKRIAADQARQAKEEWDKTNDSIRRGLTDALMRGFDSGKSFAENFWSALKNMAKTVVLEPMLRFAVAPISGAVTNALSGFGFSGGTGGGGGGGFPSPASFMNFGSGGGLFGQGSFLGSAFSSSAQMAGLEAGLIGAEFGITGVGAATSPFAGAGAASVLGPAGLAIGAAMLLGGGDLFGGGGGPKNSGIKLIRKSDGSFGVDVSNISDAGPSQAAFEAGPAAALTRALNDRSLYDPAKLAGLVGEYELGGPSTSSSAIATLVQKLQPAIASVEDAAAGLTSQLKDLTAAAAQNQQFIDFMNSVLVSPDLSPLSATERLNTARSQYETARDNGIAGDESAAAQTYLREARSYHASSPAYKAIVDGLAADAAGVPSSTSASIAATNQALIEAQERTRLAIEEQTRRLSEMLAEGQAAASRNVAELVAYVDGGSIGGA